MKGNVLLEFAKEHILYMAPTTKGNSGKLKFSKNYWKNQDKVKGIIESTGIGFFLPCCGPYIMLYYITMCTMNFIECGKNINKV